MIIDFDDEIPIQICDICIDPDVLIITEEELSEVIDLETVQ